MDMEPRSDAPTTGSVVITGLRVRAAAVPMRRPLVTASSTVPAMPLVLLDLETSGGVPGRAYLFSVQAAMLRSFVALFEDLGEMLAGMPLAPAEIARRMASRFRTFQLQGHIGMALSAIDVAAWDALARQAGLPLFRLLGGDARPIPAYNSNGLGLIGAENVAREAKALAGERGGFNAIKLRLGYPSLEEDLAAVHAAKTALSPDCSVMADYNQGLSLAEAMRRGAQLDSEGLSWIEEPIRADDVEGAHRLASAWDTPLMLGESFWGLRDMVRALATTACDLAMPDLMRIGGVTGWLAASALAEVHGLPMSSHLFPEVSAHVLPSTPTGEWLEYCDWAEPVLRTPLRIERGRAILTEAPGNGLEWDESAVARYALNTGS